MTDVAETSPRVAPWRGRPRTNDPRNAWVHVRCNPSEHAMIAAAAADAGMSAGAFMRHQAIGTAGPRAARRPQVDRVELARALGLIGLYGSNVNQLAREANSQGELPTAAQLENMAAEITETRAMLRKALGFGD